LTSIHKCAQSGRAFETTPDRQYTAPSGLVAYHDAVKEFLLDLYRDLIQPFLGPVCPFLVTPDL
jgi:hypothetical protein